MGIAWRLLLIPVLPHSRTMNYKDAMNRWRTRSLFCETNRTKDDYPSVYTLKQQDHNGLPSLYRLYMETGDITEYEFAEEHLGGWQHWLTLCKSDWFQEHVTLWRDELEVRLRSQALRAIAEDAASQSKSAIASAKYLANGEYKPRTRGRPSKAEVEAAKKKEVAIDKQLSDDAERIGLELAVNNDAK